MGIESYSELLLNQTKDLIWMVDQNLNLVYANKAYQRVMKEVTGVEKELNTSVLIEGFGEGYIEKWKAYYQKALSGKSFTIEENFLYPEKQEMQYGHISFSPIRNEDGKIQSVACRNIDVTTIAREKHHASSLVDASLDVFCTIDEEGIFVFVSEAASQHWGYKPKELIGTPYRALIVEDDLEKTDEIADNIMAGKKVTAFSNRYKKKNGALAHNLWSARWDDEAKLMYCVARDMADKIEEDQQLRLYAKALNSTTDPIIITEAEPLDAPDGPKICFVNDAFTKMTGYSKTEVMGKTPRILQGAGSDRQALKALGEKLRNWEPAEITVRNYTKTGEEFWVDFAVSPVTNEQGRYTHWISVQRNVTEQKNKEIERALLSKLSLCFTEESELSQASERLCRELREYGDFELVELWCPNLEQTYVSRISASTGVQDFKDPNNPISQFLKDEGLPGRVWKQEKQLLWNQEKISKYFLRKNEAENAGLNYLLGVPLIHQNQITGVLVIGTKKEDEYLSKFSELLKNLEAFIGSEIHRKRLEDDLEHLYEAIPEVLCVADFKGRFLKINPAGCELLGFAEEEILFHSFDEFTHPEDKDTTANEVKKLEQGNTTLQFENRYITKDGRIIWLSWSCNSSVQDGLIYAAAKDITEEKRLQNLNKQSREIAKVGGWEYNLIEDDLFWSVEVHNLHETDPDTFIPNIDKAISFYKEQHKAYVSDLIFKSINEGVLLDYEAVIISKSKKEKWIRVIGKPEFIGNKCVKFVGIFQEITDRKEVELALIESEAKFKTIFEIATLGIAQVDPSNGKIILANSYYETITGYTVDELLKMSFVELTHPDDREKDWELFSKAAKGEGEYRNEKRYIKKDGAIVWVRLHVAFIRDETGKPIKTVAICEDISDRKEAESRLTNLSDNIPGVVFQYYIHPHGKEEFKYVSKGAENIFSISPKDVIENLDLVWDQIKAGGDYEAVRQSIVDSIENKSIWSKRFRIVRPDGEKRIIQGLGTPEFLPDGTVVYSSVALDITEESNNAKLLEQATQLAKIGSWEMDLEKSTVFWSEEVHRMHETDPNSFVPDLESAINFYREDYREKVGEKIEYAISSGEDVEFEAVVVTQNLNERWIKAIGSCEMVNGVTKRFFGSFQDITERKTTELRLKSLSDDLPGVTFQFRVSPEGEDSRHFTSKAAHKIWGVSPEESEQDVDVVWDQIKKGGDYEAVQKSIEDSMKSGEKWNYQWRNILPSGELRWHEGFGTPNYLPDGTVVFNSIIFDITEKHKAKEELQKAFEEKNNILESIGDAFFTVDKDWIVTYWNGEAEKVLNRNREDILGENLWDVYADTIDTDFYRQYHKAMETGEDISFEEYYETQKKWFEVSVYPSEEGLSVYFKDITLRKESDLRVLQANERFERVTEATSDAIWDWDIEKDTFYRSDVIDQFFGKDTVKKLEGKEFWQDRFHPDDLKNVQLGLEEALKDPSRKKWEIQYRIFNDKGATVYVNDRALIIRDKQGKAIRMIGAMTDITERKQSEQERNRLQKTLENSLNEIYVFDSDTFLFNYANKGALKNLGYSADEIKELTPVDLKTEYNKSSFTQLVRPLLLNQKERIIFSTTHKRKDGSLYPVEVHLQLITEGNRRNFVAIILDITERRKAEEEIRFKANLLGTIGQAVIATSLDGVVNYWNKAAESIYGWTKEEVIGKNIMTLTTPDYSEEQALEIMEMLKSGQTWSGTFKVQRKDGTEFPAKVSNSPVFDESDQVSGIIGVSNDISKEVKNKELLEQYTKELERSNEDLEQFAFITSHDLQEPLRMITSFMDLLERKYGEHLDEKGLQYIHFASDGAKRMKQIILDLLEYSRANNPTDQLEAVDLNKLLKHYKQLRRKIIAETSAIIVADELPTITTYKSSLIHVFHNLLDNALKYSKKGNPPEIKVTVSEKKRHWEFAIADNGIGIDSQFFDKIFQLFQRLHNRTAYKGTGIGLSVAKRSVEFNGGEIWLESEIGEGSTFYFTVPKK